MSLPSLISCTNSPQPRPIKVCVAKPASAFEQALSLMSVSFCKRYILISLLFKTTRVFDCMHAYDSDRKRLGLLLERCSFA
jgi:hypothetical protein